MRSISANEVAGYFWVIIILVFFIVVWWKVNDIIGVKEVCVFQNGVKCLEKRIFEKDDELHVEMALENNLGRWIAITGIICSSETPDPSLGIPQRNFENINVNALSGSSFYVTGRCHGKKKDQSSFSGIIYLRYEYRDEPYALGSRTILGNVIGKVQ